MLLPEGEEFPGKSNEGRTPFKHDEANRNKTEGSMPQGPRASHIVTAPFG
jgi:hypothetical protein